MAVTIDPTKTGTSDEVNPTFASLTVSGPVTLSGGTANGVAYLNGSKVLTTGAALAYDGTTLTATVANGSFAEKLIGATGRINFTPYVNGTVGAIIESVNTAESAGMPLTLGGSSVRINTAAGLTLEATASGVAVTGSISATDYIAGAEQTPPSAPAANGYRIFAQDNGAGKTQLMVIFASGAAQQIAIEP